MSLNLRTNLPLITGPEQDVASAFLGPTPDLVSPVAAGPGSNVFVASGDSRQIAGNVLTTFTGPIERVELHVTDTVSNSLGLSGATNSTINIHDHVTEVLQSNFDDVSLYAVDDPYEGTCSWILTHQTYFHWYLGITPGFLWLCGPPGSGKSTLSAYLLRHRRNIVTDGAYETAYFFFSHQVEKASTPRNFLSSLLHQILQLYPVTQTLLKEIPGLKTFQSVASLTSSDEGLWNVLTQVLRALHSVSPVTPQKPLLCIIDAVEECTDNPSRQFLRNLCKNLEDSQFKIKVLVTCRQDYLERSRHIINPANIINVNEGNGHDIREYVSGHLRLWSQNPADSEVVSKLELGITSRADGIFLWAVLVVEGLLQRGSRLQTVLDTINSFPKGRDDKLRKLYEEILKQASNNLVDRHVIADLKSILRVVIMSASPLNLNELAECLEAENQDGRRVDLVHDIKNTCRGLLRMEGDLVKPFHITLKAYLEDATECLPQFYIDKEEGHAQLAETCLKYAADRISFAFSDSEEDLCAIVAEYAFLGYAASQWAYHVKCAGTRWSELAELIQVLLGDEESFRKWYAIVVTIDSPLRQQLQIFRMTCGIFMELSAMKFGPAHILSLIGFVQPLYVALFQSDRFDAFSAEALGSSNTDASGRLPAHWAAGYSNFGSNNDPADWMTVWITHSIPTRAAYNGSEALAHILSISPESAEIRDASGKTPLHLACASCDPHKVRALLDVKADLDVQDLQGYSALHHCCGPMGYDIAKLLVSSKAKVGVIGVDGNAPLHIAALHGQEQTVKLLLDHKAEVNTPNTFGMTALHYAVLYGKNYAQALIAHMVTNELIGGEDDDPLGYLSSFFDSFAAREKTLKRLLAGRANLEAKTIFGETALFIAAFGGHLQALKILLSVRADVNATNSYGWTPLYGAAFMGQDLVVQALVQANADIETSDAEGSTPIHIAAQMGHADTVRTLLKAGAKVNVSNLKGYSPLHGAAMANFEIVKSMAVSQQNLTPGATPYVLGIPARPAEKIVKAHEEILEDLLAAGADIHAVAMDNTTPLHIAALHGYESIAKILIDKGIDVNVLNNNGGSPLHAAALLGNDSCVRYLLDEGAIIYTGNVQTFTPFHAAVQMGHEATVRILLDAGAQVNFATEDGTTAIHCLIAHKQSDHAIPQLAKTSGPGIPQIDETAVVFFLAQKGRELDVVEQHQEDCLRLMLSKGADVELMSGTGFNALQLAAIRGRNSMISILLDHGANLESSTDDGYTPLFCAIAGGSSDAVQFLLDRGADKFATEGSGWDALICAMILEQYGPAKVLIENGVDVTKVYNNGTTLLHLAADLNRSELVAAILERGADVNVVNEDADCPIHIAAGLGLVEMSKSLLEHGADLNVRCKTGTPLHEAARGGHLETVKELLDRGADTSIATDDKWTPLLSAIDNDHLEVVQVLLEKGADFSLRNNQSWTPLHTAISRGHLELVQDLLARGADTSIQDNSGWTPVHLAAYYDKLEILKALLAKGADMSSATDNKWTPLHTAASEGRLEMVQELLAREAELSVQTNNGWTSLQLAASNGHTEVVRALLDKGADTKIKNNTGWTALHSAASNGHTEAVKALLEKGADLETRTDFGWTSLLSAASNGHEAVIQILLEKGADIEARTASQWTALPLAMDGAHTGPTKMLLQWKADPNVRTSAGWCPIHIATDKGSVELTSLLVEAGADLQARGDRGYTALHCAARSGNVEVAQLLAAHGVDIKTQEDTGWTALHVAANSGKPEMCKWLLEQGLDVNVTDQSMNTPLIEALRHHDTIRCLLEAKADVNHQNKSGKPALMFAVVDNDLERVKILEEAGASFELVDYGGCTLLHYAAKTKSHTVLKYLLEEKKQDPNLPDKVQCSPLHEALYAFNLTGAEILIQAGADPNEMDGYGRTAFDWARSFPVMFNILSQGGTTREAEKSSDPKARVESSIKILLGLEATHDQIPFHVLGHCFLSLSDEENAHLCFEQQILSGVDVDTLVHNVTCNMCPPPGDDIKGLRYVCMECSDVDLCGRCMAAYGKEWCMRGCRDHKFMTVPRPTWKGAAAVVVSEPKTPPPLETSESNESKESKESKESSSSVDSDMVVITLTKSKAESAGDDVVDVVIDGQGKGELVSGNHEDEVTNDDASASSPKVRRRKWLDGLKRKYGVDV